MQGKRVRDKVISILPGIRFLISSKMPDYMIELASEAFDKDRRFHLDPCYDKEAARDV